MDGKVRGFYDLDILSKSDLTPKADMHNDSSQQSSVECFSIQGKLCLSGSFIDHRALKIRACQHTLSGVSISLCHCSNTYLHSLIHTSAAGNLFHMCTIIYSFIITSRTSSHGMHAVQILCIINVWCVFILTTSVTTSTFQREADNKCCLTSPLICRFIRRWWTSCTHHAHGFHLTHLRFHLGRPEPFWQLGFLLQMLN